MVEKKQHLSNFISAFVLLVSVLQIKAFAFGFWLPIRYLQTSLKHVCVCVGGGGGGGGSKDACLRVNLIFIYCKVYYRYYIFICLRDSMKIRIVLIERPSLNKGYFYYNYLPVMSCKACNIFWGSDVSNWWIPFVTSLSIQFSFFITSAKYSSPFAHANFSMIKIEM